jgi:hypothetical protein
MQPDIGARRAVQEVDHHDIVIAGQNHHARVAGRHPAQILDHARAVGAAVDQIADMDKRCVRRAMPRPVGRDQLMRRAQPGALAVNVADRVKRHRR